MCFELHPSVLHPSFGWQAREIQISTYPKFYIDTKNRHVSEELFFFSEPAFLGIHVSNQTKYQCVSNHVCVVRLDKYDTSTCDQNI